MSIEVGSTPSQTLNCEFKQKLNLASGSQLSLSISNTSSASNSQLSECCSDTESREQLKALVHNYFQQARPNDPHYQVQKGTQFDCRRKISSQSSRPQLSDPDSILDYFTQKSSSQSQVIINAQTQEETRDASALTSRNSAVHNFVKSDAQLSFA